MKQNYFKCLKHFVLMLFALVGFTATASAQEWEEIYSNSLSDGSYINMTGTTINNYSSMASEFGDAKSPNYIPNSADKYGQDKYIAVKYDITEPGNYYFSYRVYLYSNSVPFKLFWSKVSDVDSNKNIVLERNCQVSTNIDLITESFNISEAGEYYFGFYVEGRGDIIFCDFRLYEDKSAPSVTNYSVTVNETNCTVSVTQADGTEISDLSAVPENTELKVTVNPTSGYEFGSLTYSMGTETDVQLANEGTFTLTDNATINAVCNKTVNKYEVSVPMIENGTVTVTGDDITINEGEAVEVEEGTLLTVTATPDANYELTSLFAGDGNSILDTKEFTVSAATAISATFTLKQGDINVSGFTADEGAVEVQYNNEGTWTKLDPLTGVDFGTELRLAVTKEVGYSIAGVKKNGSFISATEGYYYFTVDADVVNIEVTFTQQGYSLEKVVNPEGAGTVYVKDAEGQDVDGDLHYDDVITVTAEKNSGYRLDKITVEGATLVPSTENQYSVTGNVKVTAEFVKVYTVTIAEPENGTLTVKNGDTPVNNGAEVDANTVLTVQATPADNNYELGAITVTGATDNQDGTYTVTDNVNISATFNHKQANITVTGFEAAEGSVEVQYDNAGTWTKLEDLTAVDFGTELRLVVTAEDNYTVESVKNGDETLVADAEDGYYYFTADAETIAIEVTFAKIQYAVSYEITGEGTVEIQDAEGETVGEKVDAGTVVTVVAEAEDGYTLESIKVGDTPVEKDGDGKYTYTVNAETKFAVTFVEEAELKEYAVTWTAPKNGKLVVLNATDTVKSGDKILEKTVLTVKAIPADSTFQVTEVKDGETVLEAGNDGVYSVEVKAEVKLSATFEKIKYSVTWEEPENGRLIVKNGRDTIESGVMIDAGTELVVITEPDENYEQGSLTYKVEGKEAADVVNGRIIVTGNTVIEATFEIVKYELTYDIVGGEWVADVTVTDKNGEVIESGAVLDYGTEYVVKAVKKKEQYYYVNILVNDKQVIADVSGLTYTYTGKVTEKTHIKVDLFSSINTVNAEDVYYDGETMTLYTAGADVRVYDMTGRVVLNAEKAESVSVAELNGGIYTAVVEGVVLKFRK